MLYKFLHWHDILLWHAEYSTTESSDDVEKQELDDVSDEEETYFFDTRDNFLEPTTSFGSIDQTLNSDKQVSTINGAKNINVKIDPRNSGYPHIERRKKLPDPVEKEKGVSLWSMIKDMVGKDLTRVCLPVYFNEPISSLQKCFEELEYSYLLDRAYELGKEVYSLMLLLSVICSTSFFLYLCLVLR